MSDIGVGDWVEAIIDSSKRAPAGCKRHGYVNGQIYVVSDVGYWGGYPFVNCVGMPSPAECGYPSRAPGWNAGSFRPIYRPKSSLIEKLKQPAPPEKVEA